MLTTERKLKKEFKFKTNYFKRLKQNSIVLNANGKSKKPKSENGKKTKTKVIVISDIQLTPRKKNK